MDDLHHSNGEDGVHDGLHGGSSEILLFQGLSTHSVGPFIFACFLFFLIAFILEVARYYIFKFEARVKHIHDDKVNLITASVENNYPPINLEINDDGRQAVSDDDRKSEVTPDLPSSPNGTDTVVRTKFSSALKSWIVLGLLYSSTYLVSIFLMLIAMTYNIYLILSLTAGVTAGKLFTLSLKYKTP